MILKNKKAGERILSIYLFVIYIIVCIGVVSGVILFYGARLDIRTAEAGVLSDKVIDCITEKGMLNEEVLKDKFDILNYCNFDIKDNSDSSKGDEQYGVRIELFDFNSCSNDNNQVVCSNEIQKIEAGRKDFLEYCGLAGKKIPKCDKKEVYILDNGNGILMRITSSVGQIEKNV